MKICLLNYFWNSYGGLESYVRNLRLGLKAIGHEVDVYWVSKTGRFRKFERDHWDDNKFVIPMAYKEQEDIEEGIKILNKYDIIHVPVKSWRERMELEEYGAYYKIPYYQFFKRKNIKVPIVRTLHDVNEIKPKDAAFTCIPQVLNKYSGFIFVGPSTMEAFNGLFPGHKTVYIPHPMKPIGRDLEIAREKLVVSTSRIAFEKHLDILGGAIPMLDKDVKVEVWGDIIDRRARFVLQTKKLWYPELYKGKFSNHDKRTVYSRAVAMVDMTRFIFKVRKANDYPSNRFGYTCENLNGKHFIDGGRSSYTILEAMSCGCIPILSKSWLSYPGELKEDVNVLGCKTSKGLAKKIKMVMTDKVLRRNLRQAGYDLCAQHDYQIIAKKYEKFYKEVISNGR